MAAVIPYEGRVRELERMIADHAADWELMLFKNNITPTASTVYSDLTEADFSGYTRVVPDWGTVSLNGANLAESVADPCVFTKSGATAGSSYGWALVDTSSGNKILATLRHPDGEHTFTDDGDFKSITPRIKLGDRP